MTVVSIEWSEAVARASYPQTTTSIRELSKSSIGGECVADPAQSAASPRSTRFLCQNVPGLGARFLIGLDKSIKGAGGGSLDMPIDAVSGKAEIEVAVDSMQAGGEGCKLYKRW